MPSVQNTTSNLLVSVIIPCYNQAHYLNECIESILVQTYKQIEIVVVDDGSTDNTKDIATRYPSVKYVFKNNGGLSSARNTGIDSSIGDFLVFLDSDDWLLPEAVAINVQYLHNHPTAAFVSGSHKKTKDGKTIPEKREQITLHPYHQLLHQNYIGMIAAVMFRRWVFDQYRYDESLKSCEDYDLYLKITRDHPVVNHTRDIARYRIHGNSISGNLSLMLRDVTMVLMRQEGKVRDVKETGYIKAGLHNWKKHFYKQYYIQQKDGLNKARAIDFKAFPGHSSLYLKYLKALLYVECIGLKPKKI